MTFFNFWGLIFGLCLLSSCQANTSTDANQFSQDSLNNITLNLESRKAYELPAELDEISGQTFVKGNDDLIYCIQDENGEVFAFDLKLNKIQRTISFARDGDYEGITNDGVFFYVLKSTGSIYTFPIEQELNDGNVKEFNGLLSKGEYESIGIDTINKHLVVICKSCKVDKKKSQTTGYIMNYSDKGDVSLYKSFTIDLDKARAIYKKFPKDFNPSAMTMKSSTDEWFILSSIDKLILITDLDFNPKSVIPFSRQLYEQPEGIAFDSKGNLFISSERGDEHSGMLYQIN